LEYALSGDEKMTVEEAEERAERRLKEKAEELKKKSSFARRAPPSVSENP